MDYPISVPSIGLVGGKFVDEDPLTGTPGSLIPAQWGNAVTDEILNVILAGGLAPDEDNNAQMVTAIRLLNKQPVLVSDTGLANVYTAVNAPSLAALPPKGFIQRIVIANANTGASTYAPDGLAAKPIYGLGLQPLQGGELPAGVAVLMYLVQAGVNGGNGAWIIIKSLGGASQVAQATKSQHAVQLQQVAAVVGGARNASMVVATASATATFSADEVVVKTALGSSAWLLPSLSKSINLGTTGAGGIDTGTAPANGFVALYAIYNPATQASALLAVNATSVKAPEVYGGASMPAGYTASALVGVVPTHTVTGQFAICSLTDRDVSFLQRSVLNTTAVVGTITALSISSAVPINATLARVSMTATQTVNGNGVSLVMAASAASIANIGVGATTTGSSASSSTIAADIPIIAAQTLYYNTTSSSGGSFAALLRGYKF